MAFDDELFPGNLKLEKWKSLSWNYSLTRPHNKDDYATIFLLCTVEWDQENQYQKASVFFF